jgi:hypothetical protein
VLFIKIYPEIAQFQEHPLIFYAYLDDVGMFESTFLQRFE